MSGVAGRGDGGGAQSSRGDGGGGQSSRAARPFIDMSETGGSRCGWVPPPLVATAGAPVLTGAMVCVFHPRRGHMYGEGLAEMLGAAMVPRWRQAFCHGAMVAPSILPCMTPLSMSTRQLYAREDAVGAAAPGDDVASLTPSWPSTSLWWPSRMRCSATDPVACGTRVQSEQGKGQCSTKRHGGGARLLLRGCTTHADQNGRRRDGNHASARLLSATVAGRRVGTTASGRVGLHGQRRAGRAIAARGAALVSSAAPATADIPPILPRGDFSTTHAAPPPAWRGWRWPPCVPSVAVTAAPLLYRRRQPLRR